MLEAGQVHDAHDVVIPWPLKLIGSGADAEDTVILCPKGPDAALDFRYGSLHASEHHSLSKPVVDLHDHSCADISAGLPSVKCYTDTVGPAHVIFWSLQ